MEETSDSEQKQWARNKKQTTAAHVAVPGGSPTFPRDQDNPLGSSFGAPQQPLTPQSSSGVYDVVKPTRMKSVLITNQTAKYKPVADDITSAAGHDVVPVCSPTDVIPTRSGKTPDVDVTTNTTFVKKLRYEHNEEPIQANDPIRNYSFVIRDEDDDDDDGQSQRAEATPHTTSHEPITDSSSAEIRRETTIASGSAADNSFAERLKRSFAAAGMKHPFPSHEPFETQNPYLVVNDTDRGFDYPMAENVPCVSESKLRDDGVPFTTYFIVLRSEACWRSLLFALRVTLISLLPTFVLTEHENTKSFFAAATLVPVVAVLFVKLPCLLGEQIFLFILGCQCVVAVLVVGVFSRAVGTRYNTSAFWCCVVFGCFGFSLLGDLASKRMMMMYSIIIQQMLIQTGDSYSFTLRFVRDLTFAFMFALAAVALPFPNLCSRKAKESVLGMHKLVAAGVGNCVKAYFAPVAVDAEVALSQVPFEKIRNAVAGFKPLFLFCKYEPFEFNHNNFLRMERVQQIESVKAYLYTMAAAARKRLDTGHASRHGLRPEMREFVRGLEKPVQALAEEIMRTVVELGAHVEPEAVLEKVHYDALYERTIMLSDFVHEERCKMLLLKHLTEEETNFCLTTFTFARSLLDVAYLIEKIEQGARNHDPQSIPLLRNARSTFSFTTRGVIFGVNCRSGLRWRPTVMYGYGKTGFGTRWGLRWPAPSP
ncbi:hypothetical protein AGDE_13417 [Angomonas deanei]|uniref:Fusaric acid resistance protein-like n=1 Tax=Angomonas deanei TaxID=59799 RepID=A0A7G2CDQ9_9TRYP|nr:hypothetical protein AGDE_13417 [Angomonas deanei]CAD2216272.1 hypothetical protein, conserved [Angomonas deanei]|eukprot:EPY22363.1 hypothetical protein AGDE_13417 [Angomonas deanei]